jgi:hypothetical protein
LSKLNSMIGPLVFQSRNRALTIFKARRELLKLFVSAMTKTSNLDRSSMRSLSFYSFARKSLFNGSSLVLCHDKMKFMLLVLCIMSAYHFTGFEKFVQMFTSENSSSWSTLQQKSSSCSWSVGSPPIRTMFSFLAVFSDLTF